ncbi:hypothetical protein MMC10_003725 [Thelotrema lepadinum]|nr:hypothetical protein [Thelotrema lepadinum]
MDQWQLWIATSPEVVQSLRETLESHDAYGDNDKILKLDRRYDLHIYSFVHLDLEVELPPTFTHAIPTKMQINSKEPAYLKYQFTRYLKEYGLEHLAEDQSVALLGERTSNENYPGKLILPGERHKKVYENLLATTISQFLYSLPPEIHSGLPCSISDLLSSESWSYQIYPTLLLLGPRTFKSSRAWQTAISDSLADSMPRLYAFLCKELKVTHIAINAPIPATITTPSSAGTSKDSTTSRENSLRLPSSLIPLHGSFGNPSAPPTQKSFNATFWATVNQNDIRQVWAPLHTMFSRGNIKEKCRILNFSGLYPELGKKAWVTAVDLYAGIGYFAFSYIKRRAEIVLGWEINPWSVEGARRGAGKNDWGCEVIKEGEEWTGEILKEWDRRFTKGHGGETRLIMFEESNENAARRVEGLRRTIPPVRHVNCGYLPSSQRSWETAMSCLCPSLGGWIHAHENVREGDIKERGIEIKAYFTKLAEEKYGVDKVKVKCEHIERVKSYAPGVIHCVFDIYVRPPGLDLE